jgi:hypothetical protein
MIFFIRGTVYFPIRSSFFASFDLRKSGEAKKLDGIEKEISSPNKKIIDSL